MCRPWLRRGSPTLHGLISQAFLTGNARGAALSIAARYRLAVGKSLVVTHVVIRRSSPESGLACLGATTDRSRSFVRLTIVFRCPILSRGVLALRCIRLPLVILTERVAGTARRTVLEAASAVGSQNEI